MSNYEEQSKEIETIKERTIVLKLSDADCRRVAILCGQHGLTVGQLIENFLGDLVSGTFSNGSDERDYADAWFHRCWFGMFPPNTFFYYLSMFGGLEDCIELQEYIDEAQERLEYLEEHPEEGDPGEIESWQEDIEYWQEQLSDYFDEYRKDGNAVDQTLEDGMKRVMDWKAQYEKLCESTKKEKSPAGVAGE
jgi:hypothetical protein